MHHTNGKTSPQHEAALRAQDKIIASYKPENEETKSKNINTIRTAFEQLGDSLQGMEESVYSAYQAVLGYQKWVSLLTYRVIDLEIQMNKMNVEVIETSEDEQ